MQGTENNSKTDLSNSFFFAKPYPSYPVAQNINTKGLNCENDTKRSKEVISYCAEGSQTGIPISTVCPYCKSAVVTDVRAEVGCATWVSSIALSFIMLCWLPFCFDSFKEHNHYCPNCYCRIVGNE